MRSILRSKLRPESQKYYKTPRNSITGRKLLLKPMELRKITRKNCIKTISTLKTRVLKLEKKLSKLQVKAFKQKMSLVKEKRVLKKKLSSEMKKEKVKVKTSAQLRKLELNRKKRKEKKQNENDFTKFMELKNNDQIPKNLYFSEWKENKHVLPKKSSKKRSRTPLKELSF